MKKRFLITAPLALLLLVSLAGCTMATTVGQPLDAAADAVENRLDAVKDTVEEAVRTSRKSQPEKSSGVQKELTREEAEAIALKHAGFTADQVTDLYTEHEIDDGHPQYEVQFRQGRWGYDYEIDAVTGKILSFEKDD